MKMTSICIFLLVFLQVNICIAEEPIQMSLDEAIKIALENNLQLKFQKDEVAAAQGAATVQQGTFDPLLTVTGFNETTNKTSLNTFAPEEEKLTYWAASLSKKMKTGTEVDFTWENQRYKSDSLFTTINPAYSSAVSVGITHPLLKGREKGVQTAELEAAEKNVSVVDSLLASQAVELVASVKKAYWELLYARQDIEVKKLSLMLAERLLEDTSRKIEAGVIAPVEIYQPEAEVARREEAIIGAERSIAVAEDSLKLILNQADWDGTINLQDYPKVFDTIPEIETIIEKARLSRPDLKAAELQVEAAEILVKQSNDELKPSLNLDGRVGFGATDTSYSGSTANVFGDTDVSWKIGLTFSVSLGSHGAQGNDVAARAQLAKARTSVMLLEQEITRSSRESIRNLHLSLKSIDASKKTSLALQKRLEAEQNKFDAGLSTTLDVLEAQEAYARALIGQKRALIEHVLAQADLQKVQGQIE